jgi:hypothetical protein
VTKVLGGKSYGSIPHLPGSRLGPGDHHCSEGQARICLVKTRDAHDRVVVQEKLDGSCCAVACLDDGAIVALGRAGHLAQTSKYEQHQLFADWVRKNEERFASVLRPGERACGEWLAQAHGTRYGLRHEPFVVFDIIVGQPDAKGRVKRFTRLDCANRLAGGSFVMPQVLHVGNALPLDQALERLDRDTHGALDPIEGVVYRVERDDTVDFLVKYVRADKLDGIYLPEVSGKDAVWNWRP